jgi:hypothetical protein
MATAGQGLMTNRAERANDDGCDGVAISRQHGVFAIRLA